MRPDILTFSGRYVDFLDPDPFSITIEAVAHGLANTCRFSGHVREFYSVAQHSVLAVLALSDLPRAAQFAILMHDAHEAFVGDIASPLKRLLPDYREIEARMEAAVWRRFGIEAMPPEAKRADLIMLATEARDLMPPHDDVWEIIKDIEPLADRITPWLPRTAETLFLSYFRHLAPVWLLHELGMQEEVGPCFR